MSLDDKSRIITRRRFLGGAAATTAGVMGFPLILRAQGANKKLNIAFVGTGGRAGAHVGSGELKAHNYVAFAEVDKGRWGEIQKIAPNAKGYTDWRLMLDNHMKEIDALVVATPDHTHALPSLRALLEGKAVYCEKPLTWSAEEARLMAKVAADKKVATQMGNQGHSNVVNRRMVEYVRSGILGDIKEVHTWTNRPVWPQGNLTLLDPKPVPPNLDWEVWLGAAAFQEYRDFLNPHDKDKDGKPKTGNVHPFAWRGWFDYGCGAVGDMGCHSWDNVFWAMNPDYPSQVELLDIKDKGTLSFARQTHFKWTFPEKNGRAAFVAHWYSGGMKPPFPEEYVKDPRFRTGDKPTEFQGSGNYYVGTKGVMMAFGDYGGSPIVLPAELGKDVKVPESIPRVPDSNHYKDWLVAVLGEKPWDHPGSNFSGYAGPLTEVMLLGAITEKIGEVGFKVDCDPVKREILTKEAKPYWSRAVYRKGFELPKI